MRKCRSCDGHFENSELSGGECKTCRGESECAFCDNVVDENDDDQCEKCGFGSNPENTICFECKEMFCCCHCDDDCCPHCSRETTYKCCDNEVLCGNNLKECDGEQYCAGKHETRILDCGQETCNFYGEVYEAGSCRICEEEHASKQKEERTKEQAVRTKDQPTGELASKRKNTNDAERVDS